MPSIVRLWPLDLPGKPWMLLINGEPVDPAEVIVQFEGHGPRCAVVWSPARPITVNSWQFYHIPDFVGGEEDCGPTNLLSGDQLSMYLQPASFTN